MATPLAEVTQADLDALDAMLAGDAIGLHAVMAGILNRWQWVIALGGQEAVGADRYEHAALMRNLANAYLGTDTIPAAIRFGDMLALLRRGQ